MNYIIKSLLIFIFLAQVTFAVSDKYLVEDNLTNNLTQTEFSVSEISGK